MMEGRSRVHHVELGDYPWIIDLEDKPGVDDGLVFFVHGVGNGRQQL